MIRLNKMTDYAVVMLSHLAVDVDRVVTATELGRGKKLDMPLIKEITGGDEITARFLYSEYFRNVPNVIKFIYTVIKFDNSMEINTIKHWYPRYDRRARFAPKRLTLALRRMRTPVPTMKSMPGPVDSDVSAST